MRINPYVIPGLPSNQTGEIIFRNVCELYRENPDAVKMQNKSRKRNYVEIRQLTMVLIKLKIKEVSWSFASSFFDKDHATAIHAAKTVVNLWETDKHFRSKVGDLFGGKKPDIDFRDYDKKNLK
jgi:chromosomal replication initiation ATPase DnaA